jgi:hypothetical protein
LSFESGPAEQIPPLGAFRRSSFGRKMNPLGINVRRTCSRRLLAEEFIPPNPDKNLEANEFYQL